MPGAGLTSDRLKVFVPPTESAAVLPLNLKDPAYGAVGDGVQLTDGAMTSGSAVLTSATASFADADIGKSIWVKQAGAAGVVLATTILSRQSATQVTLASNCLNTITTQPVIYGTDDSTAINAAITAALALTSGGARWVEVFAPPGIFLGKTLTAITQSRVRFIGPGKYVKCGDGDLFTVSATKVEFVGVAVDGMAANDATLAGTFTGNAITVNATNTNFRLDRCSIRSCKPYYGVQFTVAGSQRWITNNNFYVGGQPTDGYAIGFEGTAGRAVTDGAITSGAATLTSATAAFVAGDVGKNVIVYGAGTVFGAASAPLISTISSVTNATTAVLANNASTTVTGATTRIETATNNGNTVLSGNNCNGCMLADFSGTADIWVSENDCIGFAWDALSRKCSLVSNRIATNAVMHIQGQEHVITGNTSGGQFIFDVGTVNCRISTNRNVLGDTIDNSGESGTSSRNIVEYEQRPAVSLWHDAAQSPADNTLTAVAFDQETKKVDVPGVGGSAVAASLHDNSTLNSRITIPISGWWMLTASVNWTANATGKREIDFRVNGATFIALNVVPTSSGTDGTNQTASRLYYFSAGDYVELIARQTSGGGLAIGSSATSSPTFAAAFIGY